jgi:hypothetical protein
MARMLQLNGDINATELLSVDEKKKTFLNSAIFVIY